MKGLCVVLLMLLCTFLLKSVGAAVSEQETNALVDIYNMAGGSHWFSSTNWLTGDPCEDAWFGILCNLDKTHVSGM